MHKIADIPMRLANCYISAAACIALVLSSAGCAPSTEPDERSQLLSQIRDDATAHYIGLLYHPEGLMDNGMYTLEVSDRPFSDNEKQSGSRTLAWIESIGTTPQIRRKEACYVLVVPDAKSIARNKETWFSFLLGSAVDLKAGDTWHEQIGEASTCFRYARSPEHF